MYEVSWRQPLLTLGAAAPAAAWTIKHPVYKADTTLDPSAVASYMTMTTAQLRALITTAGGIKGSDNYKLKTVAYDMARLYAKTNDIKYADRAVILLERYAEVLPSWPIIATDGKTPTPLSKMDWGAWDAGGLWGVMFHLDMMEAKVLALAYDYVAASGAVAARSAAAGKDVGKLIEDDLLRYMVEVNLRFQKNNIKLGSVPIEDFGYTNLAGYRIDGIIPFGKIVEPAYLHVVTRWQRNLLTISYCRDGYWSEGTPSYNRQITIYVKKNVEALAGYSDPAGYSFKGYTTRFGRTFPGAGVRFDKLDVIKGLERPYQRAREAIKELALPNGHYYAVHDTHSKQRSWEHTPKQARPRILFGLGHAMLGAGDGADQLQLHLHFSGTAGHEHYDALNLGLWARGAELLSEGEYKDFGNRDWNTATAGHNTVVIDAKSQHGRFDNRAKLSVDDAIDGVGFYRYQDYGKSNGRNHGNLRLWDVGRLKQGPLPDSGPLGRAYLQIVEADGVNAYAPTATIYRRTAVLVKISGADHYVLDIFRVKGGQTHDWMLHGRLNEDYKVTLDAKLAARSGTRYTHLELDKQVTTAAPWTAELVTAAGAKARVTMLGHPGTEISTGRAPAQRRAGEATFLDVRRTGGESVFVAVHEPLAKGQSPKIKKITPLAYSGDKAAALVALRIELEGGFSDIFAATLDAPPYTARTIPGTTITFSGRLVHVRSAAKSGAGGWAHLSEGSSLSRDGQLYRAAAGDFSHRGEIDQIHRKDRGDAFDGFVTSKALPTGKNLEGVTLLLILPDGRTEGFTIDKVELTADGKSTRIHVEGEPGIELRDGGKLVKYVYYPGTGLRGGKLNFLIPGSLHVDRLGWTQSTAPLAAVAPDGGVTSDGVATKDAAAGADGGGATAVDDGCSCVLARAPSPAWSLLLLLLVGLTLRRSSRRGSG